MRKKRAEQYWACPYSFPKFLGGDPKQHTTSISKDTHRGAGVALHNDQNNFLRGKTDAAGNHMRPQRGNSAADIKQNFTRQQRLDALAEFYKEFSDKYPEAAHDFFIQHPHLK